MAFNFFKRTKKEPQPPRPAMEKAAPVQVQESVAPAPGVSLAVGSSVLKRFHVSEKSSRGQAYNQYTFAVAPTATKTDVKHAVQRAFKVNVTSVKIVRLPAKARTVGRYSGTTQGVKKAIVVLKEGQTIAQAQP